MSVNEKMTALADEIRELSGTTSKKGIDAMISDVDAANTEISEQTDLIANIKTALSGKAAGGTPVLQDKLITTNGAYTADEGYDGLGTVTVEVSGGGSGDDSQQYITVYNDTDYSIMVNGFTALPRGYIDIPMINSDSFLEGLLFATGDISGVERFFYTYIDTYEGDDGEIIEDSITEPLFFVEHYVWTGMWLAIALSYPYNGGLFTITVQEDEVEEV